MNETDLLLVQQWVKEWGYPGIAVLMFLESAPLIGLTLPGIVIAIALGVLTATGFLSLFETWLYAAAGAVLGDSVGFWLGRLGSDEWRHHLHRSHFAERRTRAAGYLERFGPLGIAIGRFVWFVHPVVPPLAGISGISPWRFYLYDLPACLLWVALYIGVGHWVTGIWLEPKLQWMEIFSLVALIAVVIMLILYRYRNKNNDTAHS